MVPSGAELVLMLLTDAGHEVVAEAGTGEQACQDYPKVQPDLVVMDLSMPGMQWPPIATPGFLLLRPIRPASCAGHSISATSSPQCCRTCEPRGL